MRGVHSCSYGAQGYLGATRDRFGSTGNYDVCVRWGRLRRDDWKGKMR